MTNNPKKPNYSTMWNPDLLIGYYQRIKCKKFLIKKKHQFLQTKLAILLNFLHILRPQEAC
jgi:hypothetical protein